MRTGKMTADFIVEMDKPGHEIGAYRQLEALIGHDTLPGTDEKKG
jgi:hypothetical protein